MLTDHHWKLARAYGDVVAPCLSEVLDRFEWELLTTNEADYWALMEAYVGNAWEKTP